MKSKKYRCQEQKINEEEQIITTFTSGPNCL